MEQAAIKELIANDRHTDLGELRAVIDDMSTAAAAGYWQRVADLDFDFHEQLVKEAGNKRLERMYTTLLSETRLTLGRHHVGGSNTVRSHEHLLRRIEEGDLREVDEALEEHLSSVLKNIQGDRHQEG